MSQQTISPLTERQREILDCIDRGLDVADTAEELGLGYWTVRNAVRRLSDKIGAHMVGLPAEAIRLGLWERPERALE